MAPKKDPTPVKNDENSQDLAFGQVVIVTARWILVLVGLILALWMPRPVAELRFQILFLLILAMVNFYLHAQLLMKRPAVAPVAYLASAGDMFVVTLIVLMNDPRTSDAYIFYFPALLGLAVSFPTIITALFAGGVIGVYGWLSMMAALWARDMNDVTAQVILTRLLMLAAVAVCGNLYWRIERNRRTAAAEAQQNLMTQLGAAGE